MHRFSYQWAAGGANPGHTFACTSHVLSIVCCIFHDFVFAVSFATQLFST